MRLESGMNDGTTPRDTTRPESVSAKEEFNTRLADLMLRYQNADADAATCLYELVNPLLARYYHSMMGPSGQVEDLLQECWLRVHRARHSYRPGEPVLPWLMAIARHSRVDQFRRWRRSAGRESSIDAVRNHPVSDPREGMVSTFRADEVFQAMRSLPEGQREVLIMLKITGMTVAEVARATGSTASAVKQKAFRAYQAIRKALKMNPGGEAGGDGL